MTKFRIIPDTVGLFGEALYKIQYKKWLIWFDFGWLRSLTKEQAQEALNELNSKWWTKLNNKSTHDQPPST